MPDLDFDTSAHVGTFETDTWLAACLGKSSV